MDAFLMLFPSSSHKRPRRSERAHANVTVLIDRSYQKWGKKCGIGRGVGSLGGNGGEIWDGITVVEG